MKSYRGHLRVVPPSAPFAERYPDGFPEAMRRSCLRDVVLPTAVTIFCGVGLWVLRKLKVIDDV